MNHALTWIFSIAIPQMARQSSLAARENIIARRRTSAAFGKTHIEVALDDPLCVQWN